MCIHNFYMTLYFFLDLCVVLCLANTVIGIMPNALLSVMRQWCFLQGASHRRTVVPLPHT